LKQKTVREIKTKFSSIAEKGRYHGVYTQRNEIILQKPNINYMRDSQGEEFTLPDGKKIQIAKDTLQKCSEVLFQPEVYALTELSLPKAIITTVKSCDYELRNNLANNLLVVGGTSTMAGFYDRLKSELSPIRRPQKYHRQNLPYFNRMNNDSADNNQQEGPTFQIYSDSNKSVQWVGGSILSSLPEFQNSWISKTDYQESGLNALHRSKKQE